MDRAQPHMDCCGVGIVAIMDFRVARFVVLVLRLLVLLVTVGGAARAENFKLCQQPKVIRGGGHTA